MNGAPVPPAVVAQAKLAASQLMWALTGRQFGKCQVTVRPCGQPCDPCSLGTWDQWSQFSASPMGSGPALIDGLWYNNPCGCESCCGPKCTVRLPYPLCSIDGVTVDGVVLDPSAYTCYEHEHLARIDGECWPKCQDFNAGCTEPGSFCVTLTYGRDIPELVLMGAAELACEFIKACVQGAGPCRLPQRLQSVARNGTTLNFIDSMKMLDQGRTGLYLADLAIATFNPHGLTRRPAVWSPDAEAWRTETCG
jgi:hypothetical protein